MSARPPFEPVDTKTLVSALFREIEVLFEQQADHYEPNALPDEIPQVPDAISALLESLLEPGRVVVVGVSTADDYAPAGDLLRDGLLRAWLWRTVLAVKPGRDPMDLGRSLLATVSGVPRRYLESGQLEEHQWPALARGADVMYRSQVSFDGTHGWDPSLAVDWLESRPAAVQPLLVASSAPGPACASLVATLRVELERAAALVIVPRSLEPSTDTVDPGVDLLASDLADVALHLEIGARPGRRRRRRYVLRGWKRGGPRATLLDVVEGAARVGTRPLLARISPQELPSERAS